MERNREYRTTDQRMASYDNRPNKPRGSVKNVLALGGFMLAGVGVAAGVVVLSYSGVEQGDPPAKEAAAQNEDTMIIKSMGGGMLQPPVKSLEEVWAEGQPPISDRNPATP